MMSKYVIIGGSAGAIGAVEAIREVDPTGSLAIVTEESILGYSRPMIGDYLCGETPLEKMMYRDDRFWAENHVQVLAGRNAICVNFSNKYMELDQGERIVFEKLLIATGSKPFFPSIDGTDKEGVISFITLPDAKNAKARLERARRVVIIGGGLIGICAAEAFAKKGAKVTIVELQNRVLALLLDDAASGIIENAIRKIGIKIMTGQTVQRIIGKSANDRVVGGVVLNNGETILCDTVVVAAGVRSRIELVEGTDVKVNKGILVDEFMQTNLPDVYACGDVAEAYDFISGENRVLPQWPTAYQGGRVAGYNMAGRRTTYPGGTVMSAMSYFGIPVVAVGMANQEEDGGYEVIVAHDASGTFYKKVVLKEGVIKGILFVGDIERSGILFCLMRKAVNVEEFKEKLLSPDFGIVSLPSSLRRDVMSEELT